jgi:TIGR03009 family protein
MSRSRMLLISPLVALVSAGVAFALPQERGDSGAPARRAGAAAAPAAPRPDPARMQQILQDWEQQSAKLKTLEVDIYRIDKLLDWDDEEHYVGQAAFRAPQLAYLDFRKVKMEMQPDPKVKNKKKWAPVLQNNQVISTPFQLIVCAEKEVWQYRFDSRQIFIFPLARDERKRAIEEGPLPFLFNMKAAEAAKRYEMSLQAEYRKTYQIKILPLLDADKESFSVAWVELDRDYLLPTRIYLWAPDRKSTKDFRLSRIRPNGDVAAAKFVGVMPPGKGWKVERNPAAADPPRQSTRPQRGQPNTQAAQRPAASGNTQPR